MRRLSEYLQIESLISKSGLNPNQLEFREHRKSSRNLVKTFPTELSVQKALTDQPLKKRKEKEETKTI